MDIEKILDNLKKALAGKKLTGLRVMIIGKERTEIKQIMRELQALIRETGAKCWALTDMLPGQERGLYVEYGVNEAKIVIIFVTNDLGHDGQHNAFIKKAYAVEANKGEEAIYIIPIVLEDCNIPPKLEKYHPIIATEETDTSRLPLALNYELQRSGTTHDSILKVDWK